MANWRYNKWSICHITGTVAIHNMFVDDVKLQRIFAEFMNEIVYTTKQYNGSGYRNITHYEPLFRQLQCLEEKQVMRCIFRKNILLFFQDSFYLEKGYLSWPISFSLSDFLAPTLNQLSCHRPYIHYKVRVVFEWPEKYKRNVRREWGCVRQYSLIIHPHPQEWWKNWN